jgi:hypothetical protein
MARPIAPTPVLRGDDARRFLERMAQVDRGEFDPIQIEKPSPELMKKLKELAFELTKQKTDETT